MTKPHRATPEQWEPIDRYADSSAPYSCILELRTRIEALEATQQPLAFTGKVAAPITRDRDETGDYLIVGSTPSPAGPPPSPYLPPRPPMPDPDYKALCAELVALDGHCVVDCTEEWADAMCRLRAALAQPEPVADLAAKLLAESKPMDPEMAAVLTTEARWGLYEGSPTPQTEPVAPTDEELDRFADEVWSGSPRRYARAVLARWGTPAIEPVPVSERLPGPEDCDAEGRCWGGLNADDGWSLYLMAHLPEWSFWLPRWALPVPDIAAELEGQ